MIDGGLMENKNLTRYLIPELKDKVIVITGGAKGIGKVVSVTMSLLGAKVAVIDISEKEGNNIVQYIVNYGREAIFCKGDVSNEEQINKCMETIWNNMGSLSILINNAGITNNISLDKLSVNEWRKIIDVNLTGSFICSKAAVKYIIKSGGGSIIMVSSGSAITGSGGGAHYAASKGGINSLIRALSRELAPRGIRVNGVAPRTIDSEQLDQLYTEKERLKIVNQIPLGRLGKYEDIANVIVFLCSNLSSFITGEVILVDGGRTFNR